MEYLVAKGADTNFSNTKGNASLCCVNLIVQITKLSLPTSLKRKFCIFL